jgi:hypothetical protein
MEGVYTEDHIKSLIRKRQMDRFSANDQQIRVRTDGLLQHGKRQVNSEHLCMTVKNIEPVPSTTAHF